MSAAAARGAISVLPGDPLTWLGGGVDPLAPFAAPFAWATLAVSRRELSPEVTVTAPAAAVVAAQSVASPLTEALSQPGATTALVVAAKQFVLTVVSGGNGVTALQSGIRALETNPLFSDISLDGLLTDPALAQSAGSATSSVITALAADADVRAAIGAGINDSLGSVLGGLPAGIAPAVSKAAVALLANPAAGKALGAVAGGLVSGFLNQPGVMPALSGVAHQLQGGLNGKDFAAALDSAWTSLQAVQAVRHGVIAAVTSGVNSALTDPRLVAALGAAATSVVSDLAADPAAWSMITDLVGSTFGDAISGLLADPASAGHVAGTVVTSFLSQPAFVAGLAEAAGQLASALMAGVDATSAVIGAFDSQQSSPDVIAAVDATVSEALKTILGDSGVQDAVGAVAQQVVVSIVSGSADTSNLSPVVGQLLGIAVDSLLGDTAVQNLISDLAPQILDGTAVSDLTDTVVQAVFDQPALQAAVGSAVGEAVGSLLGDNIIGTVVSHVVAKSVTVLINVAVKFAPLLNKFGIHLPGAAAAEYRPGSSYLFVVSQ